jgi:lipopolysaccharide export system permease protein
VLLGRLYFREVSRHLLVVMVSIIFLIALGAAIRASATSQGAPIWVPLSLVPLIVGQALPHFFPVVSLISVVLGYGRMAADNEDVAAFAAGVSQNKLLQPALWSGLLVCLITYPLTAEVAPSLLNKKRQLINNMPVAILQNTNPGASELRFSGIYLSWNHLSGPGEFHDILLSIDSSKSNDEELRLRANHAIMNVEGDILTFTFEGIRTFRDTRGLLYNPGQTWLTIDLSEINPSPEFHNTISLGRIKDKPSSELFSSLDTDISEEDRSHTWYILWQRMAMSFAAIPLSLIGALLGWRLRNGSFASGFALALLFLLLVYFPLFLMCDNLEEINILSPLVAAWLPNLVLLLVVVLMSRRHRIH